MDKKQGFNRNVLLEHLVFPEKVTYESKRGYCLVYHVNDIPAKYFNGRYSILKDSLAYVDKNGRRYLAQEGMITDGASIPRVLWDTVGSPYASKYLPAYILHDHLCQHARDIPDKEMRKRLRKGADKLLREMMDYLGAGWVKRSVVYRGVGIGSLGN